MPTRKVTRLLRRYKWLVLAIIIVISIIYYYSLLDPVNSSQSDQTNVIDRIEVSDTLTLLIREYEDFDNTVPTFAKSAKRNGLPVVVVSNGRPYPPMSLPSGTKMLILNQPPNKDAPKSGDYIRTSHVAIIPDGCNITDFNYLFYMMSNLRSESTDVKTIAAPCKSQNIQNLCQGLNVDLKKWTLKYYESMDYCDAVLGKFVLVMNTKDFLSLPHPYMRPVNDALFIQGALRNWKVVIYRKSNFTMSSKLYIDPHKHWKHRMKETERLKVLYQKFGFKLVQYSDGREQYFGCSKQSGRCFGTVHNDMPEFLYQGKWTPPCCLKALRTTARYVFRILKSQGVR